MSHVACLENGDPLYPHRAPCFPLYRGVLALLLALFYDSRSFGQLTCVPIDSVGADTPEVRMSSFSKMSPTFSYSDWLHFDDWGMPEMAAEADNSAGGGVRTADLEDWSLSGISTMWLMCPSDGMWRILHDIISIVCGLRSFGCGG